MDLIKDKMAMQRLKRGSRESEKELSTTTTTNINLPFITTNQDGPKTFRCNIVTEQNLMN